MKYKVIRAFGYFTNFKIGEIREFTDAEAMRLSHLLEPVYSDSVNSTDRKPNKMYKKGEKKMKKIIALLLVFGLMAMGEIPLFAAERGLDVYSVSPSTYPITDPVTIGVDIANTAFIHHIIISNTDITIAQDITFYSSGASTTTVTSEFAVHLASTGAAGFSEPVQIPFPIPASPWEVANLMIRKSSLVSDPTVTIFYR